MEGVMIHVEFLGVPGSGKTTLQRHSIAALNREGHRAWDEEVAMYEGMRHHFGGRAGTLLGYMPYYPVKKTLLRILCQTSGIKQQSFREFLVDYPVFAANILQTINEQESASRRAQLLGWISDLITKFEIARQELSVDEMVLFDEGFCNRAMSLHGITNDESELQMLNQYLKHMPKQDHVILVETDLEMCLTRLKEREEVPYWFRGQDHGVRLRTIKKLDEQIEIICNAVVNRGVPVHQVSGTCEISFSVDTILESLTLDAYFTDSIR